MRRTRVFTFLATAILATAPAWAAANSNETLNEIRQQASALEVQADNFQSYLISGAHDSRNIGALTMDMADSVQRLSELIGNYAAAHPTEAAQTEKMKAAVAAVSIFVNNSYRGNNPSPLNLESVIANTSNIMERASMIRSEANSLRAQ